MDGTITMNLSISRNVQVGHPFHEMVNSLDHFTKWTISHLGHNIYVCYSRDCHASMLDNNLRYFLKVVAHERTVDNAQSRLIGSWVMEVPSQYKVIKRQQYVNYAERLI